MSKRFCIAAMLTVAAIIASGCGPAPNPGTAARSADAEEHQFSGQYPIQVVCTTGPVTDMLRNLGGDLFEVRGLMGPGVDPHLYSAAPADVDALQRADLIVYNGLHLEGRMTDIFERLAGKQAVIAVSSGLEQVNDPRLRKPPEFEGYYDPHLWHDPALWADCAGYVAERLAAFDPDNRDTYIRAAGHYRSQLESTDAYCREQIESIPAERRVLVTAHDAFGYFSRAYGLETAALKGISTDDEVSIGRMQEVVRLLIERKIPAVFVESAVAPRVVQALIAPAQEAGHDVEIGGKLYADALGADGSGAETYVGMIRTNVETIVQALNPEEASDGAVSRR